ncbi:MAG: Sapep family Mn(2+)-dependent dipeptidase [Lachnospiraceae bacterium]|nr:Sapep family Mn(2+)-dependent dipeptidase [Lachnospiraceae bacterium]
MYKEQIDAYLDGKKEEMLEDLKALVRIDSRRSTAKEGMPFGEGPAKALKAAGAFMERYGLTVKNYDNYVVTGDYGTGEKVLDILAHLDVVPVTEDWTVTRPFEPLIQDGNIYGRGTADDKGPAIAALYAIRAVKELNIPLKNSVRLILGSDEECGSSDLEHYYGIEKEAKYTFTPDGDFPVINLEKGRLTKSFEASFPPSEDLPKICSLKGGDKENVVPGKAEAILEGLEEEDLKRAADKAAEATNAIFLWSREGNQIHLNVKGTSAHASTPEAGNNAVTALLHLISLLPIVNCEGYQRLCALSRMFPHGCGDGTGLNVDMADEESGALTLTLDVLNYTETSLKGAFDCRAPLCATDENLTEELKQAFENAGMTMEGGKMVPVHHVPANSSFVQTLLDSYEFYTGIKGKPLAIGGGTYVHELERGVAFGCMSEAVDNHMHGDDEFMEIDTLMMSAKIFADAIVKLCN